MHDLWALYRVAPLLPRLKGWCREWGAIWGLPLPQAVLGTEKQEDWNEILRASPMPGKGTGVLRFWAQHPWDVAGPRGEYLLEHSWGCDLHALAQQIRTRSISNQDMVTRRPGSSLLGPLAPLYDRGRAGESFGHYQDGIPFQPSQIRADRIDLDWEERKEMWHFLHTVLFSKVIIHSINKFGESWHSSPPFISWSGGSSWSGEGWTPGPSLLDNLDMSGTCFRGKTKCLGT